MAELRSGGSVEGWPGGFRAVIDGDLRLVPDRRSESERVFHAGRDR